MKVIYRIEGLHIVIESDQYRAAQETGGIILCRLAKEALLNAW
jgi:hypothetical protein